MNRLALLPLLVVLLACAEKKQINFHCEYSEAVTEDGSLLFFTDTVFDLTVDLHENSVSSERYPNFGTNEPKIDPSFILWLAAPEGEDPYSIPQNGYRLSRYTGDLHVSIDDEEKGSAVAQGQCVMTKPIF